MRVFVLKSRGGHGCLCRVHEIESLKKPSTEHKRQGFPLSVKPHTREGAAFTLGLGRGWAFRLPTRDSFSVPSNTERTWLLVEDVCPK